MYQERFGQDYPALGTSWIDIRGNREILTAPKYLYFFETFNEPEAYKYLNKERVKKWRS